jgi:hypothetical protein
MNCAALRVCLALVVLSLAPPALASELYTNVIQTQLNLPEKPLCNLCHQTVVGGPLMVTKLFGIRLRDKYGLRGADLAGLQRILMQMQASGEDDSDGDGIGDIAELLQGTDPNVPEGGVAADEPRYGCYCSAVPAPSAPAVAGAAWLSGLALSSWRRRAVRRLRAERKT